jgi:hypothetical protein
VTKPILVLLACVLASVTQAQSIESPESFLGHKVGADYKLARWPQILEYCQRVAAQSDRVLLREMGVSSEGQPMVYAEISSPETIANIGRHRRHQEFIADPRKISSAEERHRLAHDSKVVVLVNCGLHANEVAGSQMAMEMLYLLADGNSPDILEILEGTIILLVPSANPDGLNIVNDWYVSTLGKPWEGTGLPELYQKYAGHDNNRDWFMLNLIETKNQTKVIYEDWRPTIVWDVHQMGNRTARMFVPPFHDPKNPNVPPLIDQTLLIIGGHMAQSLSREGKTGVVHGAIYDNWWAGGFRTTVYRHNMVGILTEAASANLASPIFQRKSELRGARRGLPAYEMTTNFPEPWPGGWWRLRDIVDYEISIGMSLFTYAARYHDTLQENYIHLGEKAIAKGQEEPPFAWLVPPEQRDRGSVAWMLDLLLRTGIEIHEATANFIADGVHYAAGTYVMYCAQPYRPHLMDMMERQVYPDRELYPGGPAEAPYDMAGWTLPLQMGVRRVAVAAPFEARTTPVATTPWPQGEILGVESAAHYVVPVGINDDYRLLNRLAQAGIQYSIYHDSKDWPLAGGRSAPCGSIVIADAAAVRSSSEQLLNGLAVDLVGIETIPEERQRHLLAAPAPRLGLYQPWGGSMDEGWTRYVLDRFEFQYISVHNADLRAGNLVGRYDVLVFPSISPRGLLRGMAPDSSAPAYTGGIGPEGVMALQEFAAAGGTVVFIDRSTNLAIEEFNIPVRNLLADVPSEDFFCPGSILRMHLEPCHPITYGMPASISAYFARSQAFAIEDADQQDDNPRHSAHRFPARVLGRYSDTVLLESGWIRGEDHVRDQAALTEVSYGEGQLILIGFGVQRRAQPHGTFRLLFNSIQRSTLEIP